MKITRSDKEQYAVIKGWNDTMEYTKLQFFDVLIDSMVINALEKTEDEEAVKDFRKDNPRR